MRSSRLLFGAAAALSIASNAFAEPILANTQALTGTALEIGTASHNAAVTAVDISTEPFETLDLDIVSGTPNLQDNAFLLTFTEPAHSSSQQELSDLALRAGTNEMRNTVGVEITAEDGVAGHVGFNAAAGAFNIQSNTAVIAALPGSVLAHSVAAIEQTAHRNVSVHHDVVNDVNASIVLGAVSGSIGINLASGAGNVQSNTVTTTLGF